jgi:hypothetical protein
MWLNIQLSDFLSLCELIQSRWQIAVISGIDSMAMASRPAQGHSQDRGYEKKINGRICNMQMSMRAATLHRLYVGKEDVCHGCPLRSFEGWGDPDPVM